VSFWDLASFVPKNFAVADGKLVQRSSTKEFFHCKYKFARLITLPKELFGKRKRGTWAMCNTLNALRLKWSKSGGTNFCLDLKRNFHVEHVFQRNWKSLLATDCAEDFGVGIVKYFAMTVDNESVSRQLRNREGPNTCI